MSVFDLSSIVKAYDIRGLVESQLTPEVVRAVAMATVDVLGISGEGLVVGHDMRPSSPELAQAVCEGAAHRGAQVTLLGVCSTDTVYFASGSLQQAAIMITASHNPPEYNGLKFSRPGAQGVSLHTGLAEIRDRAQQILAEGEPERIPGGRILENDLLRDYARTVRSLVDVEGIRPLRIVVDAANGMAGLTVPAVLGQSVGLPALPIEVVPLYFELDGTFPNHEANPLDPANLVDLQRAVREHQADLGLAFDGDADRCFVVDERGEPVSPSVVGAMVAAREIARARRVDPDSSVTVLHNLICSRAVKETIEARGATAIRTPVGHSLIKDEMARTGALFGAEHSAHYYFRDFWGADNGMLAALHVIAEVGHQDQPLSALASHYSPYSSSGEINSRVEDVPAALDRIREAFRDSPIDLLDGITVSGPESGPEMWWFNVRASNTEPLLRLNVEAATEGQMQAIRERVLELIRA